MKYYYENKDGSYRDLTNLERLETEKICKLDEQIFGKYLK